MKRVALSLVALIAIAGAGSLSAQGMRLGIGGGLLFPLGTYKDFDKMGWVVGGDATYWFMSAPVGIRADVQYSQTSEKSGVGAHTTEIIGGLAEVVYALGKQADAVRPYILGGLGYYDVKVSTSASESKVGFGGGAGLAFKLGTSGTRFFVEGKYVSVSTSGGSTNFLPIRAGFRF
jgi:outer membrane protein with beta-barrel domain